MKKIFLLALFFYTIFLFSQINIVETFYNVSVVGAVENPGVYRVLPSSRLSEVISLANNIALSQTLSQSQTSPQKGITSSKFAASETQLTTSSTRNIIIKRKDENIHIDLEKFYVLGDES
ncbi:MAG: SLBB domain-containing protein, partial [Candidatus Cloacimonetes bacterium]|nr:SLBB domain-containing protein [Candidatus Cloacimonadota bacterium]